MREGLELSWGETLSATSSTLFLSSPKTCCKKSRISLLLYDLLGDTDFYNVVSLHNFLKSTLFWVGFFRGVTQEQQYYFIITFTGKICRERLWHSGMIGGLSGSKFNDPFLTDRLGSARIHTQFVIIFANRVAVLALNIDYLNIQHLAKSEKTVKSKSPESHFTSGSV